MTNEQASVLFRDMADRIDRAKSDPTDPFGGAFLIVPPSESDTAIGGVTMALSPNPVVFWSSVQGQIEVAIAELRASSQGGQNGRFR